MAKVRLFVWNAEEAEQKAKLLRQAGHQIDARGDINQRILVKLRANPPEAIIIDLGRRPALGRDVANHIRASKLIRNIPIIFIGTTEKLPPALHTDWEHVLDCLHQALTEPQPIPPPASTFDGYKGTPIAAKLTIKPGMQVALHNTPRTFFAALGEIPKDVEFLEDSFAKCDLCIYFATSTIELQQQIRALSRQIPLWIAWPKKQSELKMQVVREIAISVGLVDYKICAIDATWSAMLFTKRKK